MGLECPDDEAAIIAGRRISSEIAVASSDRTHALHLSVINDAGNEVQKIPVIWP